MAQCTVLIAEPELLPSLIDRARGDTGGGEVLTFTSGEVLRALEAIVARRPGTVALERAFAATPRGVALINRIKVDPSLADVEIRVISKESQYAKIVRPASTVAPTLPTREKPPADATSAVPVPPPMLDAHGTRRAPRYQIAPGRLDVNIDGNQASLVDLSVTGTQVVSPTVIKPNQRVRIVMAMANEGFELRMNAIVMWASFEMAARGPQYRAGLEFVEPDQGGITTLCARHGRI